MIDTQIARRRLAFHVNRLLKERAESGLEATRAWLARQLGVNDSRMKLVCEGTHDPSWSFVKNLAEILGVSDDVFKEPIPAEKTQLLIVARRTPKKRVSRKLEKVY